MAKSSSELRGDRLEIVADKSISHRALFFGAAAIRRTRIKNLSMSKDVLATAEALSKLGTNIAVGNNEAVIMGGVVPQSPADPIECGNSGTTARLLLGYLLGGAADAIGRPLTATLRGDESLSKRPMNRALEPLALMGATFSDSDTLPLTITAATKPIAVDWRMKQPSAQVKSAIILAALGAVGETGITETVATRDHSENMLPLFGGTASRKKSGATTVIKVKGPQILRGCELTIPADPSATAFLALAAAVCPNSRISVDHVGANPHRLGFYRAFAKMGANLSLRKNAAEMCGEPTVRLEAASSELKGIATDPADAAAMIDEYPALFVAAAFADGVSRFCGLGELRLKESNRLDKAAELLVACGVKAEAKGDDMIIEGGQVPGGAELDCGGDHRLAMAFTVLGLAARSAVAIKGAEAAFTSFPGFYRLLRGLGARLDER